VRGTGAATICFALFISTSGASAKKPYHSDKQITFILISKRHPGPAENRRSVDRRPGRGAWMRREGV